MCAYEGDDNFLYSCDQKCCNEGKGCPGECNGVPSASPQGVPTYNIEQPHLMSDTKIKYNSFMKIVLIVIVSIVVINLLIALVYGTSNSATKNAPGVVKFVNGVNKNTINRFKSMFNKYKKMF